MRHSRFLSILCSLALTPTLLVTGCGGCNGPTVSSTNRAPDALILSHKDGDQVFEGDTLLLAGNASDDRPPDELRATWWIDGEVVCPEATPAQDGTTGCETVVPGGPGEVRLQVSDASNRTAQTTITLDIVPNNAPVPLIVSPIAAGTFYSDYPITFSGTVSDPEDAPDAVAVSWESDLSGPITVAATPDSTGAFTGNATLDEGTHLISLKAVDTIGKIATDTVTITVGPPNTAPTCGITAPPTGSASEKDALVTFEATVADVDISPDLLTVTWTSDKDGQIGTSTANSNGEVLFSTDALSVDSHTVTLTVTDEVGESCTDFVTYTVGTAPSITLDAPGNGDTYKNGELIAFKATVADTEDVPSALTLNWNSSLDGDFSTQGPDSTGVAQFQTDTLSEGTHALTVTVTDSAGLFTTAVSSITLIPNTAPSLTDAAITPDPAVVTDTLTCTASGFVDAENDPDQTTFSWESGGSTLGTGPTLDAGFEKGDTVTCIATPFDGTDAGTPVQASITIGNSPPDVTNVTISPGSPASTDTLTCSYDSFDDVDSDGDLSTFAWSVNGTAAGTGETLSSGFAVGDTVTCEVTPNDGTDTGTVRSDSVTVENSLPTCSITGPGVAIGNEGDTISFTATVSDGDQDPDTLTVSWESDIDGSLGTDAANGSGDATLDIATLSLAAHTITLTVTDDEGVDCTDTISFEIGNAPTLTVTAPTDESEHKVDTAVTFAATVNDLQDGPQGVSIAWVSDVDGTLDTSSADATGAAGFETDTLSLGSHTITVTVTDTLGLTAEETLSLDVVTNRSPSIDSVEISPDPAFATTATLTCASINFDDPDGDPDQSTTVWTRGAEEVGTGTILDATSLTEATFARDEEYTCTITPDDGESQGTPVAAAITISNSLPTLSGLAIDLSAPKAEDTLNCSYTTFSDADDGDTDQSSIGWQVNGGTLTAGTSLSGVFVGGDTVTCVATPNDGLEDGTPVSVNVTIENTVPTCAINVPATDVTISEAGLITFEASVDDPDENETDLAIDWADAVGALGTSTADGDGNVSFTPAAFALGEHVVTMTVTDATSATCTDFVTVTVSNAPTLTLNGPTSGESFADGLEIAFSATVDDVEDAATDLQITWSSDLDGAFNTDAADGAGETAFLDTLSVGTHTVTVTVTDTDGLTDEETFTVTVTENDPPSITSVLIDPNPANELKDLTAQPQGWFDTEGASPDYRYSWQRFNGGGFDEVGTDETLSSAITEIGDLIQVTVTPTDGAKDGTPVTSTTILIEDSCPAGGAWSKEGALCLANYTLGGLDVAAGYTVSSAGDINKDGKDDVIIGAARDGAGAFGVGRAYLFLGTDFGGGTTLDLANAHFTFDGVDSGDHFGRVVATAGDVDGDGFDDLLIGAPYTSGDPASPQGEAGTVSLFLGKTLSELASGTVTPSTADFTFYGAALGDHAGMVLSPAGDVDGDGMDDFVIGAPDADPNGAGSGAFYLVLGVTLDGAACDTSSVSCGLSLSTAADRIIAGEAAEDGAGAGITALGDIDGDHLDDLLIGAPGYGARGRAYLLLGQTVVGAGPTMDLFNDADHFLDHSTAFGVGTSVAGTGDMDGDGIPDMVIGGSAVDGRGFLVSAATVAASGRTIDMNSAATTTYGPFDGADDVNADLIFAAAGDVDGDNLGDLIVAAQWQDDAVRETVDVGKNYLFLGDSRVDGAMSTADADVLFAGIVDGDLAGIPATTPADIDGDTLPDPFFGAPAADGGQGQAYILVSPFNAPPYAPTVEIDGILHFNDLVCSITTPATDPDGDAIDSYEFEWFVDGQPSGYSLSGASATDTLTVPDSATTVDEVWTCVVRARDSGSPGLGLPGSADVTIHWMKSCLLAQLGNQSVGSGTYTLERADGSGTFSAYCDMDTDGGGWTAIINPYDLERSYLEGLDLNKDLGDCADSYTVFDSVAWSQDAGSYHVIDDPTWNPDPNKGAVTWGWNPCNAENGGAANAACDTETGNAHGSSTYSECAVEVSVPYTNLRVQLSAHYDPQGSSAQLLLNPGYGYFALWDYPGKPADSELDTLVWSRAQGNCFALLYIDGELPTGWTSSICNTANRKFLSQEWIELETDGSDVVSMRMWQNAGLTYQPRYLHEMWVR